MEVVQFALLPHSHCYTAHVWNNWRMNAMKIIFLTLIVAMLAVSTVSAHTRYDVDGGYAIVVGWAEEPPVVDNANAIYIEILDGDDPFVGADQTIDVQLLYAGGTRTMNLEKTAEPGVYHSELFIPTVRGTLDVRVFGELDGTAVDLTAPPEEIASADLLQFPEKLPSEYEQLRSVADLEAAVQSAQTFGLAGIAAGVLGIAIGAVSLLRRK